jgi:hypothetical protein
VTHAAEPARPLWPALVAPVLVTVGIGLLRLSDALLSIGPLDRAQFGWSIPIPMILAAPAVGGLAGRWTGERSASRLLVATAVGLGLVVISSLVASIDHIGCSPQPDKVAILAYVAPIGIVAALGYLLSGAFSLRRRDSPIVAFLGGVGIAILAGAATLMTFAALFPGLTCTPGSLNV